MSDDEYHDVEVSGYPGLKSVRLYDETIPHISQHSELEFPRDLVPLLSAISSPTRVHQSATKENGLILVSDTFQFSDNPVHVPVMRVGGSSSARVSTAYFRSGTYRGDILWVKGDE